LKTKRKKRGGGAIKLAKGNSQISAISLGLKKNIFEENIYSTTRWKTNL